APPAPPLTHRPAPPAPARPGPPPIRQTPPAPTGRRKAEPIRKGEPVGKSGRPTYKDRDPVAELAISEIAGHLTFTQTMVTAWYWLPEVRWAFRPDADREALIIAISEQYAGLAG